ncbi:MAG: type I-E CRISPR-associated protein Cas7/Cse4/CasC [Pelistega sp.]|nr:type I-E CRISPR-associated protein Cas7/Cse4/CasC [Pelistega sp.]
MTKFIQLHLLTSYPPSNLNRDDLGRPKTARFGGFERLRVSSQSLKRSWRTSDLFLEALDGEKNGIRTKRFGEEIYKYLIEAGVTEKKALEWAIQIAGVFGKVSKEHKYLLEQLVHISQHEQELAFNLAKKLIETGKGPSDDDLKLLSKERMDVDMALFGRMLASSPAHNIDAACQVAHALSVGSVVIEDDYFTAVDDLNDGTVDTGSAHIGEFGFASAIFYLYICIDKELLVQNLGGNEDLVGKAVAAIIEAAAKVAPSGKQNSFASRAYASYVMVEKGRQQPRTLSSAFLTPIQDKDMMGKAISALEEQMASFDKVYGSCADSRICFDVTKEKGSLKEVLNFVKE